MYHALNDFEPSLSMLQVAIFPEAASPVVCPGFPFAQSYICDSYSIVFSTDVMSTCPKTSHMPLVLHGR